MKTWTIKYQGNVTSARNGGTSLKGIVDIRAVGIDDALAKFYLAFNKATVRITSIVEGD